MPPWVAPRKQPLLSDGQRQAIHDGALQVLDRIGVEVEDAGLRRTLARHGGVRAEGARVHFSPELIERVLHRPPPAPWQPPPPQRVVLGCGGGMSSLVDIESDAIRPMLWEDAVAGTKLVDALHAADVHGRCPGTPQDIPPNMWALSEFAIGALYSRFGGDYVSPCGLAAYDHLMRMHELMGQEFALPLYVLSPLRLAGDSLQVACRLLGRVNRFHVGSMPLMGATAPVYAPSAFMQALAESLAGLATIKLLRPDAEVSFDLTAYSIDMKYGSMLYSSPESNLCDMIRLEMSAFYGRQSLGGRFIRTMAKRPGVQAAAEKAASAIAGVMAGAYHFSGAGKLSLDEVFSAEMLVIDRELADYAERLARGFDFGEEAFDVAIILDGVREGSYLDLPSTVEHFRDTYWLPRLMDRQALNGWRASGEEDMRGRARAEVRRLLSSYDFQLPVDTANELRALYASAAREIVGGDGLPEGRMSL